jgi:cytochrome c biogenesis protein
MAATRETTNLALNAAAAKPLPSVSWAARAMDMLSSVRFGVVLLSLLALACVVGMLIMQVNVEGFDKYYAELTPSQRLLYGKLDFFDIYHAWYFNALLMILSLNIILSSIDHFPKSWALISRPKLHASAKWLAAQEQHAALQVEGESAQAVAARVSAACRGLRLKPTFAERGNATYIFAERGAWNRLGAYAVHVALLTIFAGGFLTAQFGHTGQMPLAPGESASEMSETIFNLDQTEQVKVALPFAVECTDIRQQLLERDGALTATNTLNWSTGIRVKDPERGEREAVVELNRPFDYRGYRFFQASFVAEGKARQITLRVTPDESGAQPQEITIKRDGSAQLADGTTIKFADFYPDFALQGNRAATQSSEYNNPAAALTVTKATGETASGYAFRADATASAPMAGRSVAGYKFQLADFERVGAAHILSVQKDPGANVVYLGFVLLSLTLCAVFFYSHQRVWARIEERGGGFEVLLGGNTNRSKLGFEDRFKRLVKTINDEKGGVSQS